MTVAAGQTLLHYRIVEKIGEGGMGAVWKAVDTTLGREVAIKILPEAFADHPERLARFEREARMLATLSHPGIAAVHSVHEAEGRRFLAMELVPGEDLEQRLKRGPLPLDEALDVARQLADALEAAHERGVIHRDLKPANIRLTPDGRVKVLDLGLAKALDPAEPGASGETGLSRSPTVTSGGTMAGVILGTAAYMSPEQAKGVAVDRRSDVWAFGVVLHEMLTGRRLFAGETVSEVIAAVLRGDIELEPLPAGTPAGVRRLLARCLEREPRRRLRDMGDARLELDAGEEAEPAAVASASRMPFALAMAMSVVALASLLAMAAVWLWGRGEGPSPTPVTRFALYDIGMPIDAFQGLAISPDGQRLVFRARDADGRERLHLRAMDSEEVQALPGTEMGWLPFFSPDGTQVGLFHLGRLMVVKPGGSMPHTIAEVEGGFSGGAWLPDGSIVFASGASPVLRRVSAVGGAVQEIPVGSGEAGQIVTSPWPLPGGRALLVSIGGGAGFDVAVLDLSDGSVRVIAQNGFTPTYSVSGHVIYQQGNDGPLMALPFDLETLRATGPPLPLTTDVGTRVSYQVRMFTVAGNGTLAYIPHSTLLDSGALVWLDRAGESTPIVEIDRVISEPRLSPDGGRIAFRTPAPNCDIWVHSLERGTTTRITREGDNHGVAWSPDGRRLAFARQEGDDWGLMTLSADGAGQVEAATPGEFPRGFAATYTPDGTGVIIASERESTGHDLDLVSLSDGSVTPLLDSRFEESSPGVSPDGRFIAYVSNESGRGEVYVSHFPSMDSRMQISTDGGTEPVWSRRGDELFFRSGRRMMVVEMLSGASLSPGRPRVLFEAEYATAGPAGQAAYDVSPDGERFVMVRQRSGAAGAEIKVVLGWAQELLESTRPSP